jgi:hypothetical protein
VGWAIGQAPRAVKSCIAQAIADAGSTDASAREVTVPCLQALLAAARPLSGGQPTLPASV